MSSKYGIPGLEQYSEMLEESDIIESILPRRVENAEDFESKYPWMFN
jgi:hypothetical protein